jgi:hypothetical protein
MNLQPRFMLTQLKMLIHQHCYEEENIEQED